MKHKFTNALSLALIVAMLFTSLALADTVQYIIADPYTDTVFEGGSTSVGYYIQAGGQGGSPGCDVSSGVTATFTINVPPGSGVTADPDSLTFDACDVTKNVSFTATTEGDYQITVSKSSGSGTYETNSAKFTLHVLAVTNTPPSVSVTGVSDGASYEFGFVPVAECSVTDAEDGPSTFAATLSAVSGPLASYGLGTQTATCSFTDSGNLNTTVEATYEIVDTTAPSILFVSRTPAANVNGWNNTDVTVNWSCTDNVGVVSSSASQILSGEGENQSATGTCTDLVGLTASNTQTGINIDKTVPTASASASPLANANGWNNTNVTVSFSGADGLSGIASCSSPVTLNAEGAGQSASGTCTDKAGNVSALATASDINIDKTAPTNIEFVGGPAAGGSYYFGSVPSAPTCTADGAISGLASCNVTGYSAAVGSPIMTATAKDLADNTGTATRSYTVLAWTLSGFYNPVDMNGVYNVVKGGSTVPLKFKVSAGPNELTSTSVVQSFVQTKVACDGSLPTDEIEVTTTGGTSLRYDATGGQFVQNWQTPKAPGTCYRVTMTTLDGSYITANFKLK